MIEPKRNFKIFVITITTLFVFMLLLIFISPRVLAQSGTRAENREKQQQLALFLDVFDYIQKTCVDEDQVTPEILIEGAMKGMLEALDDPYSTYLTKSDMEEMAETTTGKFGGVGLYILEADEGGIEVARPIPGTPAYKAGISASDIIIAVDDVSVMEMKIDEVIDLLKGDPGTPVKMTVLRGLATTLDFTVIRDIIEIPTVRRDMIMEGMGYLRINQFTPLTYGQVKEAIEYFKTEKYTSMVIDLRSNPGGLLTSVVNISDLFLPAKKLIVSTKSRKPSEDEEHFSKNASFVDERIKIVILTDKYSASASEIFTGVMKDYSRAVIVGEKTYGKGSVQEIRYLGGAGLKLTMAKYYTPSGITIHEVGIEPHIEVIEEEFSDEDREELRILLDDDRIKTFVEKIKVPKEKDITKFIATLRNEGIDLDERYLRKMIRNEVGRHDNDPPIFDLEYDLTLQKGVWVLQQGLSDDYLKEGQNDIKTN